MKFQYILLTAIIMSCATRVMPLDDKQAQPLTTTKNFFMNMKTFDGRHDNKLAASLAISVYTLNPLHILCYQRIKNGYKNAWSDFKENRTPKNFLRTAWFGANRGLAINNIAVVALSPWYVLARSVREYIDLEQKKEKLIAQLENISKSVNAKP